MLDTHRHSPGTLEARAHLRRRLHQLRLRLDHVATRCSLLRRWPLSDTQREDARSIVHAVIKLMRALALSFVKQELITAVIDQLSTETSSVIDFEGLQEEGGILKKVLSFLQRVKTDAESQMTLQSKMPRAKQFSNSFDAAGILSGRRAFKHGLVDENITISVPDRHDRCSCSHCSPQGLSRPGPIRSTRPRGGGGRGEEVFFFSNGHLCDQIS